MEFGVIFKRLSLRSNGRSEPFYSIILPRIEDSILIGDDLNTIIILRSKSFTPISFTKIKNVDLNVLFGF